MFGVAASFKRSSTRASDGGAGLTQRHPAMWSAGTWTSRRYIPLVHDSELPRAMDRWIFLKFRVPSPCTNDISPYCIQRHKFLIILLLTSYYHLITAHVAPPTLNVNLTMFVIPCTRYWTLCITTLQLLSLNKFSIGSVVLLVMTQNQHVNHDINMVNILESVMHS